MSDHQDEKKPRSITRRQFLRKTGEGLAMASLPAHLQPPTASWSEQFQEESNSGESKPAGASIRRRGSRWTLRTAAVKRVIVLEDGKLLLQSWKDPRTGHEFVPPAASSEEFFVTVGSQCQGSASGQWTLVNDRRTHHPSGELQLDLTLRQGDFQVAKSYIIYPGSSVIREWVTFTNSGQAPVQLENPGFLSLCARPGSPGMLDFHWMTGGENQPEMWLLKTEPLEEGKPRLFNSSDPFPTEGPRFPGDGINARVVLNEKQIWPEQGWQYIPNSTVTVPFHLITEVAAGDRLVFLVNMNQNIGWDTTSFDPTLRYEDGETHTASAEFSDQQGQNGWRYQYLEDGKFVDLVYYSGPRQWRKAQDNSTGTPFVGPSAQHPDVGQDAARVWTAPRAGRVEITGSVSNNGNQPFSGPEGFRMGSSSYAPWVALLGRDTACGVFLGWDYFGHWASSYELNSQGAVTARLWAAGHKQILAPGESVTTPMSLSGLFHGDLDEAGNELLDWQYRYLWDYTRDHWFPAVRMLGYWWNGTGWGQPDVGWTGGKADFGSAFRKVFRVVDLMREVGGDVYHRDWGWWDRAGDWNGPDFRGTHDYLRKHSMGQLIYAFLYTVDPQSQVARDHPDWVLAGNTLDMSRPEVVEFMLSQLETFYQKWGDFEWRNDSTPTAQHSGDDTPLLAQDQGFRKVIRTFLDRHPDCAFQSVNGGGNDAGYDYVRYSSTLQFSDGAIGIRHNYYSSLLFPPDKNNDNPDQWNPDHYDKGIWRRLLCSNFDMTGDTWDPVKIEGLRKLIDIYHYLQSQGVVGRGVRVYRPRVTGDDPVVYFQRLSADRKRGIIIPKRPAPGPVTIWPKGLPPGEQYLVSCHESPGIQQRTGADLVEKGISFERMIPGELIYLNLPLHPGSKRDLIPPTPPRSLSKRPGENMGYPGIELAWKPGTDNNWLSYYEVFRNGQAIGRVAKGTFYFDHSAGADLAALYEVQTVDGSGNTSGKSRARGPSSRPARILDDTPGGGIEYSGAWQRQQDLPPGYQGSISFSEEKGAAAHLQFTGKRILWFSKLGADCGLASVQVNDNPPETVDTYSADDIWGVCVYQKELPTPGPHTLRITVQGQHSPHSSGSRVYLDGVRVEE